MNGLITRLILTFVGGSLTFTLLPLLESGNGAPLIAVVDRSRSLVVYAGFLVLFALLVLPLFLARTHASERRWPWIALVGYVLVFAAIPLVFTAYISGVSVRGLVPIGALCAFSLAIPLALCRGLGTRWGARVSALLGSVFVFALPGVALYLESVGRVPPRWIEPLSLPHWLHRIATLREVPESVWPFMAAMAIPWVVAAIPRRWPRKAAVATAVLAAIVLALPAAMTGPRSPGAMTPGSVRGDGVQGVEVRSLAGGVGRAGLRTPLAITLPAATGTASVSAGLDAVRVPRDGATHHVVLVPGEGARRLRVESDDGVVEVTLPVKLIEERVLVGVIGPVDAPDGVPLAPEAIPLERGALEAFDVIAVGEGAWDRIPPRGREALLRWAALGGRLARQGSGNEVNRGLGAGREVGLDAAGAWMRGGPSFRATALDGELTRTFAPPNWQQMDLSALLLFTVIYHGVFLLAFLIPALLDSRKALGVYLVSVGFVVLVVAGFAWHVLGEIFLRDNQVYTHSITLMVADDGPTPRVASRQFLCFASMSAEDRSLRFGDGADLVVYQSPYTPRRVVRAVNDGAVVLEDVHLDRFRHKLVVRVDREAPLPFTLEGDPRAPSGARVVVRDEVPDALGLRDARLVAAWHVEGGRIIGRLEPRGDRLVGVGEGSPTDIPGEVQVYLRKLLGHFVPPGEAWLLVQWADVPRADEAREWLWSRDLGGWLLLPVAPQ